MKRLSYIFVGALALGLLVAEPALAAPRATAKTTAQRLTTLKTKGGAEIDRRVARLSAALTQIQAANDISQADKDRLIKSLQDQITALNALKAKLAAETQLPAARADIKSISDDYRVYRVNLAQARMLTIAVRGQTASRKLSSVQGKLEEAVAEANVATKGELEVKLGEMKTHLADADKKFAAVGTGLNAVSSGDPGQSQQAIIALHAQLKEAHADLKAGHTAALEVLKGLGVEIPQTSANQKSAPAPGATQSAPTGTTTPPAPAAGQTATGESAAPAPAAGTAPAPPTGRGSSAPAPAPTQPAPTTP